MSAESNNLSSYTASLSLKERIKRRSHALQKAREFFFKKGLFETDCFILGRSAAIDLHIDLFKVSSSLYPSRYLFSSPEYPMKRLLAQGASDIFYLGHVFRHEDMGIRHSPEFTMAEWYRIGFSFQDMITETLEFILDTLSGCPELSEWTILQKTYRQVFEEICGINPHTASHHTLLKIAQNLFQEKNIDIDFSSYEKSSCDDLLHLMMSCIIEPSLQVPNTIIAITHYPATQAALAKKIHEDSYVVSERFEIYVEGIEVANGYHELSDWEEQAARFHEENRLRNEAKKEQYPVDTQFLEALKTKGLPNCSGVAVGFDRLLMAAWRVPHIGHTTPFPWAEA